MGKLYQECAGIAYVASLCAVPALGEVQRFGPPKLSKRGEKKATGPALGDLVNMVDNNRLAAIDSFANQQQWSPFGAGANQAALDAARMAAEADAAQRLLAAQRSQSEAAALLQYLSDKIAREREMAAGLFATKDAQIERWKTMAGMLSNENKDLAALLQQLLDENAELRRRIAEEKAAHSRFVRGILDRHVAAAEQAIAAAVKRHQQPDHQGTISATGADVGRSVDAALAWAHALQAAREDPAALVAAIGQGNECAERLLDNVKGATTALRDPTGSLLCDTAASVASTLQRLVRVAADGDGDAAAKLVKQLETWLATLKVQSKRLTDEEEYQQISGEEWSACQSEVAKLRAALSARADEAARRLRDAAAQSSGVAKSVAEACESIAGASNALVGGVLDNVQRRMNDGGRKFKRDAEWVATLLQLCQAVADGVDALVLTAVAVAQTEDPALWPQLMDRAEALRAASLALVDHLKTRYSDAASTERMGAAYRAVTAAIKALIDSVAAYRKAQQEQEAMLREQGAAFQEDRTAIVEKRALVHRLKAQVQRKRTSTENLTQLLAGGGPAFNLSTGGD